MSYWDNYQSRVLKGATTSKERITNDLEQTFEKYLNQSLHALKFQYLYLINFQI